MTFRLKSERMKGGGRKGVGDGEEKRGTEEGMNEGEDEKKSFVGGKANLAKERDVFFAVKRKIIVRKDEIGMVERKDRRK